MKFVEIFDCIITLNNKVLPDPNRKTSNHI